MPQQRLFMGQEVVVVLLLLIQNQEKGSLNQVLNIVVMYHLNKFQIKFHLQPMMSFYLMEGLI